MLEVIKGLSRGGAETLLLSRLQAAAGDPFTYVVANTRPDLDDLRPDFERHGIEVLAAGPSPWALKRVVRSVNPDLVNVHSPVPGLWLKALLGRNQRAEIAPVLVETIHNVNYGHLATRTLSAASGGVPCATIAVSGAVASSRLTAKSQKVYTVIHGVDATEIAGWRSEHGSEMRQRLAIPDSAVTVAVVANFRPQKNHGRLVSAVEILASRGIEANQLVIVCAGTGPTEASTRKMVQTRELGAHFRFLGSVPDGWKVIASADAALLTSDHEGLPVAVMEAGAAGVPFLATDVGGVRELVTDGVNGLIFPPSAECVAEALQGLTADEELRARLTLGARSKSVVSIDAAAQMIGEIYQSLLGDG